MKYCKVCVQPDTRPGIAFDDEGVCAACRYRLDEFPRIDWTERQRQLREIADWAKRNAHGGFDCVIGVSGGKDSHVQALYVKEQLGLNALLVNCAPDGITEVGRHNLENLVQHGFDMISFRPNPRVMRTLTRRAFFGYGNPVKPSEYPLYAVSSQAALKFGIPLIVQGENIAITLGVRGHNLDHGDDALSITSHNTLGGINASDWVQEGIELKDLLFYQWPDEDELREKVRAIHLNYYVKEWSWTGNIEFAVACGLRGRVDDPNLTGRLSPYTSVDSDMQIVNQMLKYYKFGFGFVTDEVCYDIREGRLSREEAIKLVEQYDGKCDERYIREFCEYIDISADEFWEVVDGFVNKKLFRKDLVTGEWKPLFEVGHGVDTDLATTS